MRKIGYYIPNENNTFDIAKSSKVFSDQSYKEHSDITKIIFELQPSGIQYKSVRHSYNSFVNTISEYKSIYLNEKMHVNMVEHISLIASQVLNVLTSVSAFLSSSEIKIKKLYGKDSEQFIAWNLHRRELHKNSFAYQFLYELRNYSQHSSLPISKLSTQVDFKTNISQLSVYISKADLLESGYKWGKYEKKIAKLDNLVNLSPLIDEYVQICHKLFTSFMEVSSQELTYCGDYLAILTKLFKFPKNSIPVIFLNEGTDNEQNSYETIPFQNYKWVNELTKA